jgi:hypothetical protein
MARSCSSHVPGKACSILTELRRVQISALPRGTCKTGGQLGPAPLNP